MSSLRLQSLLYKLMRLTMNRNIYCKAKAVFPGRCRQQLCVIDRAAQIIKEEESTRLQYLTQFSLSFSLFPLRFSFQKRGYCLTLRVANRPSQAPDSPGDSRYLCVCQVSSIAFRARGLCYSVVAAAVVVVHCSVNSIAGIRTLFPYSPEEKKNLITVIVMIVMLSKISRYKTRDIQREREMRNESQKSEIELDVC